MKGQGGDRGGHYILTLDGDAQCSCRAARAHDDEHTSGNSPLLFLFGGSQFDNNLLSSSVSFRRASQSIREMRFYAGDGGGWGGK